MKKKKNFEELENEAGERIIRSVPGCEVCGAKPPVGYVFATGICKDCDDEVCLDDFTD